MTIGSLIALAGFALATFTAASSGAVFRPGAWYAALRKPPWTPPNWAFPVVWSVLYLAIATAGWLIWETGGRSALPAIGLFAIHLVLNGLWSYLFFGRRRLDWAMAEVVALWLSIAAMIAAFAPINPVAAWLLAPYLAWVTIASFLNFRLLQLNGARGHAADGTAAG